MQRLGFLLLIAATSLIVAACGDAATPAVPDGASVTITAPTDGATVSSPVTVTMDADEFTIEPAGAVRDGAGHFHLMIDVPCVEPGLPIPMDGSHIHYGDGATEAQLDLEPGEYTICLQAGNGIHTAIDLTDTITITVTE